MEGQIVCKKCGKVLPQEYAACPACGRRTKRSNGRLQFSLLGWIIAACFLTFGAIIYFGNGTFSSIFNPVLSTPSVAVKTSTIAPSPTQIVTLSPSPTKIIETPEMYKLSYGLDLFEFITNFNGAVGQIGGRKNGYIISKISIPRIDAQIGEKDSIKYNIGNDINLTLCYIGKAPYIYKLYFVAPYPQKSQNEFALTDVILMIMYGIPNGGQFMDDIVSANNSNYVFIKKTKNYSESIEGVKYSFTSYANQIQIEINFTEGE
jgi:hypothetical protein